MTEYEDYLKNMGITRWYLRRSTTSSSSSSPDVLPSVNWSHLQQCVANCQACDLYKTRTKTVFGVGNPQAKIMFIGEAPGAEEDRQGLPFVGRAGQLLTEMLLAMGLKRDEVFIANILKCRPPHNRDPKPEEVKQCTPFLHQQLQFIQPKLLVGLGRIAAHHLLQTTAPLTRLRGQQFYYGENRTPLLITYHPAYLLRMPVDKAKAYQDLQSIQKTLRKLQ